MARARTPGAPARATARGPRRASGRHAAPSRLPRLPGRVAARAGVPLLIGVVACLVPLVLQWQVWFQPDLRGVVTGVSLTGREVGRGKGGVCAEAVVQLSVDDGQPGELTACDYDYSLGDSVNVRRERSDPGRLHGEPLPGWGVPLFALAAALAAAAATGAAVLVRAGCSRVRFLARSAR